MEGLKEEVTCVDTMHAGHSCPSFLHPSNLVCTFAASVPCPCHNQGGVLHIKAIDHHNMLMC